MRFVVENARTPGLRLALAAQVAFLAACDRGVDFEGSVLGHSFGRAGAFLGKTAQVVVDFEEPARVLLRAEVREDDLVTESADAGCDTSGPEEGWFETRLPATDCVFLSTLDDNALPEAPTSIVLGLKNADGSDVEIDPSLEASLPSPFSFVDGYNVLRRVD